MEALIAVLPGDGIGPEVVAEGVRVLRAVGSAFGHSFEIREAPVGGAAIEACGEPLPRATVEICQSARAVFLGAIGDPRYDAADVRPEAALLELRRTLGLFANLRPIAPHEHLLGASPIKRSLLEGVDMMFVRELTGGIYFGEKHRSAESATDVCTYTQAEVERVVRIAARLAGQRRGKLTSIDKANVLETSRLWRSVTERVVREEFGGIELEHLLVDAAAMHLLRRPRDFDVIVTENLFGDVLTDEASVLTGSLGMLPSASLGTSAPGLFEPVHGSAPDIAGSGSANPLGAILSVAMMLRYGLGLPAEADAVDDAVTRVVDSGMRTVDLEGDGPAARTAEVGQAVSSAVAC